MKKRIVFIAIVVLALLLVIAHFTPLYKQKEVLIHSPIIRPAQELNSPAEWYRWNPIIRKYCLENPGACALNDNRGQNEFNIQAGQHSFVITARGASYDIAETNNGKATLYNYTLASSIYNDTTRLIVTEKTNLLSSLLSTGNNNASQYADSLKIFIEDPSAFYGFPLKVSPIIDTLVLATHRVVLNKNPAAVLKDLYKKLDDFIQTNHLKVVRPKIARFEPEGKDSIDVTVGMPVDRVLPVNSAKYGITFLNMPSQAHMIVGSYKGSFSGRVKLYQALYKYLSDRLLKPALGTEYDEYVNNIIPENDSSIVEINVCIPHL